MFHWLLKKANSKQQPEVVMEEQCSRSSIPQALVSPLKPVKLDIDVVDTLSNISGEQTPQEHIAQSISKMGNTVGVDSLGAEVEFPEDAVSSESSHFQTEFEVQGDVLTGSEPSEVNSSLSPELFDELLPSDLRPREESDVASSKCIPEKVTPVTCEVTLDNIVPETLSDNIGHKTLPDNMGNETLPDNNGHETSPDNNGHETSPDNNGHETSPDNNGHETSPDNIEYDLKHKTLPDNIGDDTSPDNFEYDLELEVLQTMEDISYMQSSEGVDDSVQSSSPQDSETENVLLAKSDVSFTNTAEVGFQNAEIPLPVAAGFQLHKYKSETGLHNLSSTMDTSVSAALPNFSNNCFGSVPVLCKVTDTNTQSSTSKAGLKGRSAAMGRKLKSTVPTDKVDFKKNLDDEIYMKNNHDPPAENTFSQCENISLSSGSSTDTLNTDRTSMCECEGEFFNIYKCRYPYPCCSHSSCLYNQSGRLCTVLGKQYIITEVNQVPLLICLESEGTETSSYSCRILWRGNNPLALSSIEDGTDVMFDAMVLPESMRYVATVVWHTIKPQTVPQPMKGSLVFLGEVAGFQVQLINLDTKKRGIINAVVNGKEEYIKFSSEVVFRNGRKISDKEDLKLFFHYPPSEIYVSLNEFLVVDESVEKYFYAPTCIWNGLKPSRLFLPQQIIQGNIYNPHNGCMTSTPSQYTTLHCDVPGTLSTSGNQFKFKFILYCEVKSLVCTPEKLYCQNNQVSLITPGVSLKVKCKAHILERKVKKNSNLTGKYRWNIIMIQVPEVVVTKTLVTDKTVSLLESVKGMLINEKLTAKANLDMSTNDETFTHSYSSKISHHNSSTAISGTSCSVNSCIATVPTNEASSSVDTTPVHNHNVASNVQVSLCIPPCNIQSSSSLCSHPSSSSCPPIPSHHQISSNSEYPMGTYSAESTQSQNPSTGNQIPASSIEVPSSHLLSDSSKSSSPSSQPFFSPTVGSPVSSRSSSTSRNNNSTSPLLMDSPACNPTGPEKVQAMGQNILPSNSSADNSKYIHKSDQQSYLPAVDSPLSSRSPCATPSNTGSSFSPVKYSMQSVTSTGSWSFGIPGPVRSGVNTSVNSCTSSSQTLPRPINASGKNQNLTAKTANANLICSNISSSKQTPSNKPLPSSQIVKGASKAENVAKPNQGQLQKAQTITTLNKKVTSQEKSTLFLSSCRIVKLATNTGILQVTGNILEKSNPMASFHHQILFVDGKSLTQNNPNVFKARMEPYQQAVWKCLLQKCREQVVSKKPVNFTACLMWIGCIPTKQYNKYVESNHIQEIISRHAANVPQNLPVAVSSRATHPKPVLQKGFITNIYGTGGTLKPLTIGTHRELQFMRHQCFLYNVPLHGINLETVLSTGLRVEYEECFGKVTAVYAGSNSASNQDSATRYYLLSAWCQQYEVPLKSKESLLLAVGWLPPEFTPKAPTEGKSQVVIPE